MTEKQARGSSARRQQFAQFAEPGLLAPPARDRSGIDRLARLPQARGPDRPLVALGAKAGIVPVETGKGDQPPGDGLAVGNQILVIDFGKPLTRQRRASMLHQPGILSVSKGEVGLGPGEIHPLAEIREIHREASVDRMAAAMDDARLRQQQVDEAEANMIERRLVGDTGRLRSDPAQ